MKKLKFHFIRAETDSTSVQTAGSDAAPKTVLKEHKDSQAELRSVRGWTLQQTLDLLLFNSTANTQLKQAQMCAEHKATVWLQTRLTQN